MDNIIASINHALRMASNRFQWYMVTKDKTHITDCMEWNEIANFYMKKLNEEYTNESICSI